MAAVAEQTFGTGYGFCVVSVFSTACCSSRKLLRRTAQHTRAPEGTKNNDSIAQHSTAHHSTAESTQKESSVYTDCCSAHLPADLGRRWLQTRSRDPAMYEVYFAGLVSTFLLRSTSSV